MKERKKEVKKKKRVVEIEGVVDEGEGWRRGEREREGISFMREIAMKPIKFKYPNFKVSYIIYDNYFF